jgi:hypothetical protein
MPKHVVRELDLSAAQTKAKPAAKPLSGRQVAEYQAALAGLQRWLPKLRRASNAIGEYQRKISYYERLAKSAER